MDSLTQNDLITKYKATRADSAIAADVRTRLQWDTLVEHDTIKASVTDARVVLSGSVGSAAEKSVGSFFDRAEATDVVSSLSGVTLVDDELKVREPAIPYVYSAYLDPYTPYTTTWYVLSPQPLGTDSDIVRRIKDGFIWSPFVHSADIHVSVVNGKGTLTGTVRSYRERKAASDNAMDAGAVSVHNELKVG